MATYTLRCTECGVEWFVFSKDSQEVEKCLDEYCPKCDGANIDILTIKDEE